MNFSRQYIGNIQVTTPRMIAENSLTSFHVFSAVEVGQWNVYAWMREDEVFPFSIDIVHESVQMTKVGDGMSLKQIDFTESSIKSFALFADSYQVEADYAPIQTVNRFIIADTSAFVINSSFSIQCYPHGIVIESNCGMEVELYEHRINDQLRITRLIIEI
jgi:hypothetical protein